MSNEISQPNRKSRTLQRILTAARTEFTDKGLEAARMDNIARSSGVTKQLINHYFLNKNELYQLVFDDVSQSVLSICDETHYVDLDPVEAIRFLVNKIIDVHVEKPGIAMLTLDQGLHRAAHINPQTCFVPITRDFINNVLEPILHEGARLGVFRSGVDATLFYATAYHVATGCFLIGPAMTRTVGIDFDSPEGVAAWRANALDFIMASLGASGGRSPTPVPGQVKESTTGAF